MFLSLVIPFVVAANEPSKSVFTEKIEIRVGSEMASTTDLKMMEDSVRAENPKLLEDAVKTAAINAIVDRALKSLYLQQIGHPVTDQDVTLRLNSIRQGGSEKEFRIFLESKGLTLDRLKANIKYQIEHAQFINAVRMNSIKSIEDKDLRAYFKNNPDQFKKNFEVDLQECVIPFGSDPQDTQRKAEFFVEHPKKFNDCVKELSVSPSAARGGKIGTFGWGILREDVENKIANLKAGEIAAIKQIGGSGPAGIQLLKILKTKNLGPVNFEAAQDRIREHLENEILEKSIQNTLSDLRSKTFIQIGS